MDFGKLRAVRHSSGNDDFMRASYRLITETTPMIDVTEPLVVSSRYPGRYSERIETEKYNCFLIIEVLEIDIQIAKSNHQVTSTFSEMLKFADNIVVDLFANVDKIIEKTRFLIAGDRNIIRYADFIRSLDAKSLVLARKEAVGTIQQKYKDALLNPYCKIGFNNINRMYDDYVKELDEIKAKITKH
jgi:hypothetical protein